MFFYSLRQVKAQQNNHPINTHFAYNTTLYWLTNLAMGMFSLVLSAFVVEDFA